MDSDEKKELIKKLKLGDKVWIPTKKLLFPNDGYGMSEPCLVAQYNNWGDGEVTAWPIVNGVGPKILAPLVYEFAGMFKSDESWQQVWFFRPYCGSHSECETRWFRNTIWNDLCGKCNVQAANLKHMLPSKLEIHSLDEICFDVDECTAYCKEHNKKEFDAGQLVKGLRRLQKIAKNYEKELASESSS